MGDKEKHTFFKPCINKTGLFPFKIGDFLAYPLYSYSVMLVNEMTGPVKEVASPTGPVVYNITVPSQGVEYVVSPITPKSSENSLVLSDSVIHTPDIIPNSLIYSTYMNAPVTPPSNEQYGSCDENGWVIIKNNK